jgi:hypothetical protein
MLLASHHESARLKIEYYIQAQFTPLNHHDWANHKEGISAFRGQTLVYIFRPTLIFPARDLKFTLKNKIGGFLGMGTTECISEIIFDRNEYYIGETAHVRIICDNSRCEKAVRGFKFKLHRKHLGKDNAQWATGHSTYVAVLKAPGCPAKTKVERTYEITIPTHDKHETHIAHTHPDERVMLDAFTTSVQGQLINVQYTLRCYVKHDAWNEFGEGNCVTLPIRIMQPPVQLVSNIVVEQPQNWQPQVQETVHLAIPVDDAAKINGYQQQVLMPNEMQWYSQAQPTLVSEKEQLKMDEVVESNPVDTNIDHLPVYEGQQIVQEDYTVQTQAYNPLHDPQYEKPHEVHQQPMHYP